jgi:hypothetical protein
MWHVHGSWTTSFVQGPHTYYVPVLPDRGPDGRGRARTWEWPDNVVEVDPARAAELDVDVLILQRPHEFELASTWLHRTPGADVPAVYLEHNAPQGRINDMRHPAADRRDLRVVHVTHFNSLFWDTGFTPATVIEHGVVDPGFRFTGELERAAVVINEASRRGRVTGTDLLPRFARIAPVDVFGMDAAALGGVEDLSQEQLHAEMARRRLYLHPVRWTSLGLSLLEAMHLGLPIVALATTEVAAAVPADAGVVSNRMDDLEAGIRRFLAEPEEAALAGKSARAAALSRYGLDRFLDDWDRLLSEVAA